jgi:hypothetical protein
MTKKEVKPESREKTRNSRYSKLFVTENSIYEKNGLSDQKSNGQKNMQIPHKIE